MKVSVILPTYNEAGNIVELVECVERHIPPDWDREIVVVDDNSPDQTYRVVCEAFKTDAAVVPILRTSDRGLAKAIRAGIAKSSGERILVMDTDFTHDPAEIPRILHVALVYDIVSGSRFCAGGRMQDTHHYLASLVYNWLIRLVLRTQVQDNLGGFFVIDRPKLEVLPFDRIFFGYGDYYFRLLHYAQRYGLSIVEVPTYYGSRHAGTSKSNFTRLLFSYTRALLALRAESSGRGRSWATGSEAERK